MRSVEGSEPGVGESAHSIDSSYRILYNEVFGTCLITMRSFARSLSHNKTSLLVSSRAFIGANHSPRYPLKKLCCNTTPRSTVNHLFPFNDPIPDLSITPINVQRLYAH